MESLLDFNQEFDVGLYDRVVAAFFTGQGPDAKQAKQVLEAFQDNHESWARVPQILEQSNNAQSKYIGLQILEKLILTRWKTLPEGQRQGIRNFIVTATVQVASEEGSLKKERTYISKLNLALIQILKQEWPHNWPTFIPELVESSKTNLSICENNMAILKLLSEEVFDFSLETMTSAKVSALKQQMWDEFSEVFKLCTEILQEASKVSLIRATLETMYRFLNWIPLGFIFETPIIDLLTNRFLAPAEFRNVSLRCLGAIAALTNVGQYGNRLTIMYTSVMGTMTSVIPPHTNIAHAYLTAASDGEELVLNLALFLTSFFANHVALVEDAHQDATLLGHAYLVKISAVEEREIFKICIEYWTKLLAALYNEQSILPISSFGISFGEEPGMGMGIPPKLRKDTYVEIMTNLRLVVIERMVKPEEVLVVENDEGEIVREHLKEIDTIVLYKAMREVLVYLTHLDVGDTENILTIKLSKQVDGSEWSWANLNTLCWAIGSISGAMSEDQEKRFLVGVIKDLLGLVEIKRGKDNKAVVASNIMYIVGQYPRFLKAHWKFLKTVVNKLFEFMHETHEGVQDMACDTFIKIAQKCRRHFVMQQSGEKEPFINEILRNLNRITLDLAPAQVHTFYEAVGYMIAAQPNAAMREKLLTELMSLPNGAWEVLMAQAAQSADILSSPDNIKLLSNVLKSNTSACTSIGPFFLPQLARIFMDMLGLYKAVSTIISEALAKEGPIASRTPKVRQLRTVKKDILKLTETYIQRADDLEGINSAFIPSLLEAILGDYQTNVPSARDAEVLALMATVVGRLQAVLAPQIIPILEAVFEPTLGMITQDFTEFPEHRLWFYRMLEAIEKSCFSPLLLLRPEQFKMFMNSIFWAIKHTMRDIADVGLNVLFDLLLHFSTSTPEISTPFFQSYFLTTVQEIFFVLTDSEHKSGFALQTAILARLFALVDGELANVPVFEMAGGPTFDGSQTAESARKLGANKEWLRKYCEDLLGGAFGHVQKSQITEFTTRLTVFYNDATNFKAGVRDFLIQLKEFGDDGGELYLDEKEAEAKKIKEQQRERAAMIPGMLKPDEIEIKEEDI